MIVQKDLPNILLTEDNTFILIGSDIHFPYHDEKAVKAFIDYAETYQPFHIVLAGDIVDFYKLSRFSKGEGRLPGEELEMAKDFLQELRLKCPDSDIYYIIGNHETRLERFVNDKAPEIANLVSNFYDLIGSKSLGVKPCGKITINNSFVIEHGTLLGNKSGLSAIKQLDKYYISGASGHTHRLSKFITRKGGNKFVWLETGCLCSLNPHYVIDPDWQQGFATLYFRDGKLFNAKVIEIEDGEISD